MRGYRTNDTENEGAVRPRSTREPSMEFGAFMRSLEEERFEQSQNKCSNGEMSMSLQEATANDTFNSKLQLQDLPSERNFGTRVRGSFCRLMNDRRMSFGFRKSTHDLNSTENAVKEEKSKKAVKFSRFFRY